MSKMYWSTQTGEVEVAGWEAHWVDRIPQWLTAGIWGLDDFLAGSDEDRITKLCQMLGDDYLTRQWETVRHSAGSWRAWRGFTASMAEALSYPARTREAYAARFVGLMDDPGFHAAMVTAGLPGMALHRDERARLKSSVSTRVRHWADNRITYRGKRLRISDIIGNTALSLGSPCVQFLVKLSAFFCIHGYIEPIDRMWAAAMLREGRQLGLLRPGGGWRGVITFLEDDVTHPGPVVLSYSGDTHFPDADLVGDRFDSRIPAGWKPSRWSQQEWDAETQDARDEYRREEHHERFAALDVGVQWELGMAALRGKDKWWLRIGPGTLPVRFVHTVTIPDVLREAGWLAAPVPSMMKVWPDRKQPV